MAPCWDESLSIVIIVTVPDIRQQGDGLRLDDQGLESRRTLEDPNATACRHCRVNQGIHSPEIVASICDPSPCPGPFVSFRVDSNYFVLVALTGPNPKGDSEAKQGPCRRHSLRPTQSGWIRPVCVQVINDEFDNVGIRDPRHIMRGTRTGIEPQPLV
jgi:hypothetical protein